ncbi:MAG: hypothetical protein ABIE68_00405 [bacterium]
MKKIILLIVIIVIVIILCLVALFIWYQNFNPVDETTTEETTTEETNNNEIPIEEEENQAESIVKILDNVASSTTTVSGQSILYINTKDGRIHQTDLLGEEVKLIGDESFKSANRFRWSDSKNEVLISKVNKDGSYDSNIYYNFTNDYSKQLSSNIRGIEISPNSEQIVYEYVEEVAGFKRLAVSDIDGSNWENVLNILPAKDMKLPEELSGHLKLYWHDSTTFLFHNPGNIKEISQLYSRGENSGVVLNNTTGLQILPSPFDNKILFAVNDEAGKMPALKVLDNENDTVSDLLYTGLPDKCLWFNQTKIFCGIPQNVTSKDKLPDDFENGSFSSQDSIVSIDISNGKVSDFYSKKELGKDMDIEPQFFSSDDDWFYFRDKNDNTLYRAYTILPSH